MMTLRRTCPRCSSWDIFKSHFRFLEFILPLFLLRPVRCGDCYSRFYRPLFYSTLSRGVRVRDDQPDGHRMSA